MAAINKQVEEVQFVSREQQSNSAGSSIRFAPSATVGSMDWSLAVSTDHITANRASAVDAGAVVAFDVQPWERLGFWLDNLEVAC